MPAFSVQRMLETGLAQVRPERPSNFRSILLTIPPRILTAMFESLRATTVLGLLAAGFPALLSGQATASSALPQEQQNSKAVVGAPSQVPKAGLGASTSMPAQRRPITASGFVKSGPVVFIDDSEKAGLTHWTHKMGTPEKSYIVETKGSGVGLIDYDNSGWLSIYVVNGSTVDALTGKETPPHAALFHNNHDGTFTDVAAKAGVTNARSSYKGFQSRQTSMPPEVGFEGENPVLLPARCTRRVRERLRGPTRKFPCGGGVGVAHSRVVASHGLSLVTFRPAKMLQKKLTINTS